MQIKTLALIAISATAVLATPHRGRHHSHHRGSGTGRGSAQVTGDAGTFPVNGTDAGLYPNATDTTEIFTRTVTKTETVTPSVSAVEAVNKAADITSDCGVSTVTEFSTQFVTVTAAADGSVPSNATTTSSAVGVDAIGTDAPVAAGAFYGSRGSGRGRGRGSSTAANGGYTASSVAGGSGSTATSASGSTPTNGTTPPSGASGSKRGISFNDASMVSAFGNSVSWAYNWADSESGNLGNVEFVPMMWGVNSVSNFASKAGNAKAVLSFNEPDLGAQANIDPQTAAKKHIEGMKSLFGKARIGSPAITNADSTSPLMGLPWMKQFLDACAGQCNIDFLAFHWYSGADTISYFESYVQKVASFAQENGIKSIWLTEFKPDSGSDADQAAFMAKAIPILEANPMVERYAGFMASDGTMLNGGSLNAIGKAYAG